MNEPICSGLTLQTPVQYLKGVGPARAEALAELGIHTASDLLEYYPRSWIFLPEPISIRQMRVGQKVCLMGIVESTDYQPYRRKPLFEVLLADQTGVCRVIWFYGGYLVNQIEPGRYLLVYGTVRRYKQMLQLVNPKFVALQEPPDDPTERFRGAVYPASAKLPSWQIRRIIRHNLDQLTALVPEIYPATFLQDNHLLGRAEALAILHDPPDEQRLAQAQRRLKFDELFLMQTALALRRRHSRLNARAPLIEVDATLDQRIRRRFPFMLTDDQNQVIREICKDMAKPAPMNRLLQGDVGSGKTVVALYAALAAIANKLQVAFMAPTEILARQHYQSIQQYLDGSRVRYELLVGGITNSQREEILAKLRAGQIDIVVGTVALLEPDVVFARLGLVIIDEQHKFGVHQRAQLRKGVTPHCLVMTATPIPRTLAMTAFGDLDVSVIRHSPPGRGDVITRWVEPAKRPAALEFIRQRLRAGRQAYFVYPRIDTDDESGDIKSAVEEYHLLKDKVFPEFTVGLLHGQLPPEAKENVMAAFRRGEIHVLVSTIVIEVGVDVPNATIMVIENANRFGLAQLHQLRGRIGRGQNKSYCLLFAQTEDAQAISRLEIMTRTTDGFEIAEQDLRLRGPGELFSARQHGLPDLKLANLTEDGDLLQLTRRQAFALVERDPALTDPQWSVLRRLLIERFGQTLGLADVG